MKVKEIVKEIVQIVRGEVLLRTWFRKNIGLFLLIAVLLILYIANRYGIETTINQIEDTNKEIKELELKRTSIKNKISTFIYDDGIGKNIRTNRRWSIKRTYKKSYINRGI